MGNEGEYLRCTEPQTMPGDKIALEVARECGESFVLTTASLPRITERGNDSAKFIR
jgi:hypothetical protein